MGKKLKPKSLSIERGTKPKVSYPVWFYEQVKAGKLRLWQQNEVSVFFREKGLSDSEEADKYTELLKLY